MYLKPLVLLCLLTAVGLQAQQCPIMNFPAPGSSDVPVDVTITWPPVTGINGYSLTLGTSPGAEDILTRRSAGLTNSFTPPVGLPENTRIYVTISMFLDDGLFIFCREEMYFETEDVTTPPPCTSLAIPLANAVNVNNETEITWNYASTATGYRLSIGTSPGSEDILPFQDVGNRLSYNPPQNLPPESEVYVRIVPYNENGDAGTCTEEMFRTGVGGIDCGPFRDPLTGQSVVLGPELNFPEQIGVCLNELPTPVTATDPADGYRWFRINNDNSETLISATSEVLLSELGFYRHVAYNNIDQNGTTYECEASQVFRVISSEVPSITGINRTDQADGAELSVEVAGSGDYEYALDSGSGPYQDSPVFVGVGMGVHTIYVRDRNGCGVREEKISLGLPEDAFPKFFTPNGDGINDFWQFSPSPEFADIRLQSILIFDRFGALLFQINPGTLGWDGQVNGRPVPASSYWFLARDNFNNELSGYFALKR